MELLNLLSTVQAHSLELLLGRHECSSHRGSQFVDAIGRKKPAAFVVNQLGYASYRRRNDRATCGQGFHDYDRQTFRIAWKQKSPALMYLADDF